MKKNSLKTNIVFNVIYQLTATIMPLITAPYISRIIGAQGLGVYSYYNSIALYFVYFAMLGIMNYANRMISKHNGTKEELNRKFSSIYYLQLITSTVVLVAYSLFILFAAGDNKIIPIIMYLHVASAVFDISWLFFGLQEFKITSIRQLCVRFLSLILLFLLVKTKDDLWLYTLIMSLGYLLSSISLWVAIRKRVKLVKCAASEILSHFKPCLVLFVPIIATSVYRLMDKVMIGNFSNMTNVGYYENAEKLIFISSGVLGAIAAVIMPRISNLIAKRSQDEAKNLFTISMNMCMIIAFAIAFGIASVSNEFIPIFFGEEFQNSINISIMLCVSMPFMIWSLLIRNLYLIPYEHDGVYVKSVIAGAAVNFVINVVLIPLIGVFGAVIGTIAADVCLALCQTYPIRRKIGLKKMLLNCIAYLIIGSIMAIVVRLTACVLTMPNMASLLIEIGVGAATYIALVFLYIKFFSNYSISDVMKVLRD